ncbi:MAG: IS66 family insertion sequence element accessory protein TnpB [Desulfobacterales bacterium]
MIPENSNRVYLALGGTDMRKAINGLSVLVEQAMDLDPFSGDLFVFCNRRQNIIKILYWDENDFCLWKKRLEEQRFKWPKLVPPFSL